MTLQSIHHPIQLYLKPTLFSSLTHSPVQMNQSSMQSLHSGDEVHVPLQLCLDVEKYKREREKGRKTQLLCAHKSRSCVLH